jgi:hypothetical protein
MRYHLRPAGAPPSFDKEFDGCYNARRNNLTRFWRRQFGHSDGVALWHDFYEHVDQGGKDVVLEFTPAGRPLMTVACLYSYWTPPPGSTEPAFWSFAAVTDDPPPEVAAAGHDRCIIPLRPEHLETWLNPDPANLEAFVTKKHWASRLHYDLRLELGAVIWCPGRLLARAARLALRRHAPIEPQLCSPIFKCVRAAKHKTAGTDLGSRRNVECANLC